MYIIFVFIHLSLYGMETIDNSFAFSHNSLVKNHICIQYSTATGKCIQRSCQEDRIAVHGADFFWSCAVFDGHRGSQTAEILANQTNGLLNDLHNQAYLNQEKIKKVYTKCDKKIENSKKAGKSGSTAVTFTVDVMRRQLFLAHCGDSIGLLIRDNKIVYWTVPHDTSILTEVTRIRTARGTVFDNRVNGNLNVTRSFGDYSIMGLNYDGNDDEIRSQLIIADPEVFETKLQQRKPVIGLLCSNGFTDYFCDGMRDLSSKNIKKKLLDPLATIICKLIECGRPISGLAFDLVCLMNWDKSVDMILNSINKNMDWDSIKNKSSSWKSYDNVSVVVFEVSDSQDNEVDSQDIKIVENDFKGSTNTTDLNKIVVENPELDNNKVNNETEIFDNENNPTTFPGTSKDNHPINKPNPKNPESTQKEFIVAVSNQNKETSLNTVENLPESGNNQNNISSDENNPTRFPDPFKDNNLIDNPENSEYTKKGSIVVGNPKTDVSNQTAVSNEKEKTSLKTVENPPESGNNQNNISSDENNPTRFPDPFKDNNLIDNPENSEYTKKGSIVVGNPKTDVSNEKEKTSLKTVENFELGNNKGGNHNNIFSNTQSSDTSKHVKNPSLITKIFNYGRSFISFKRICFGALGLCCLTPYILKKLCRFKNA